MTSNTQNPHWTKNPIVWLILFFPTAAVVAGFNLLYLAIESDDGLVDSDYYKLGMTINQTLDRDINAVKYNINGFMSINGASGSVQVRFSNDIKTPLKSDIAFKLVHRTIPGFDQKIMLKQVDDTMLYNGTMNALPISGGRWRWELKLDDWRVSHRFMTKGQEVIAHDFPYIEK